MSTTTTTTTTTTHDHPTQPTPIHIHIPPRYYLLPGAAVIVGTTIGLFRGSRKASLRFLAENAHRPPTTVQGWYFYNKTKNYRVILGGIKGAASDALRLATIAAGWVAIEDTCHRTGLHDLADPLAGLGTAAVFSTIYRLPWRTTSRTLILGFAVGGLVQGLRWSKRYLQHHITAPITPVSDSDLDIGAHK